VKKREKNQQGIGKEEDTEDSSSVYEYKIGTGINRSVTNLEVMKSSILIGHNPM
jgi:hypothetical protein